MYWFAKIIFSFAVFAKVNMAPCSNETWSHDIRQLKSGCKSCTLVSKRQKRAKKAKKMDETPLRRSGLFTVKDPFDQRPHQKKRPTGSSPRTKAKNWHRRPFSLVSHLRPLPMKAYDKNSENILYLTEQRKNKLASCKQVRKYFS